MSCFSPTVLYVCMFVFINSTSCFLQTDNSCIVGKKCWEVIQ